jgi:hypothetical protein
MKLKKQPSLKKVCDNLWSLIIRKRAGYKSEISDLAGNVAHHIVAKPNNRLRFELRNGICLNNAKEHIYGVHHKFDTTIAREYQDKIISKIGADRYVYLLSLRKGGYKTDLKLVKIFLQQELIKLG